MNKEFSEYSMLEQKLREGMFQGNMHHTLRDIGRTAGGLKAANRISADDCEALGKLASSMAINKAEAARKWNEAVSFGEKQPLLRDFTADRYDGEKTIGWNESVSAPDYKIIDEKWLETEDVEVPDEAKWNPCQELTEYLTLLFEPEEHVAYCTDPFEREGKFIPSKGTCHKTVEELLKSLKKNTDTGFSEAVGTTNPQCGAWIVINPVDGKGRKDENITDFRYALVESDEKPIDEQVAIYRKLELPCVCIVHSGGKSAHAIVRINASSLEEYRKRVDFLYEVCSNNGLPVDKQNRNPSRYSRMPGVVRNNNKQFIIDRNCGKSSWDEWENWIKDLNDNLPEFEPLTAKLLTDELPEFDPEIIEGILRVGDNAIISGPPKAGKSFMLIELAIAVARGGEWLGRKCRKGKVLYVNLELRRASCYHRFRAIYDSLGIKLDDSDLGISVWNMRGNAMGLSKLSAKLIRRAKDQNFDLIILDPAYQVLEGDENSSEDVGAFMRQLISITASCNSTVILCHHHSKGVQGEKRSIDRSSGSSVFSRSPDAILDLLPLDSENARQQFMQTYECAAMIKAADEQDYDNWRLKVSEDDKLVPNRLCGALEQMFDENQMEAVRKARADVVSEFESVTGWRLSFTLRDFRSPAPQDLWFKYPAHVIDDGEILKDCSPEGENYRKPAWQRKTARSAEKIDKVAAFKRIIEYDPTETWTISKAQEHFGVGERTIKRYLTQLGWASKRGVIIFPENAKMSKQINDLPF